MSGDGADASDGGSDDETAGEGGGEESVRVWLVDREVDSRDLVTLTYATPDGERAFEQVFALAVLNQQGRDVTAAREVAPERLEAVAEPDRRERFAGEATRMADRHAPDDAV